MGRSIYANEIGSSKSSDWVHKFWFGVQPSKVDDYLTAYEVNSLMAELDIADESGIRATMLALQREFEQRYGLTYKKYMAGTEANEFTESPEVRRRQVLASRINLGEHLLATIENMKAAGMEIQELTIEV